MNIKDRNKGDLWWLKHERDRSFIIKNIYRIERSCEWIRWQRYDEGDESNINK